MSDKPHIIRAEKAFEFNDTVAHPWNPESIVTGTQLDRLVGFERVRLSVARVPAGVTAQVYHSHECEEEWIYVLQGSGVIEIGETEEYIGAGDFVGFPASSPAHQLRNNQDKVLICLLGGEKLKVDITDFPRMGKRMFRGMNSVEIYDTADAEETAPVELDEVVSNDYRKKLGKSIRQKTAELEENLRKLESS